MPTKPARHEIELVEVVRGDIGAGRIWPVVHPLDELRQGIMLVAASRCLELSAHGPATNEVDPLLPVGAQCVVAERETIDVGAKVLDTFVQPRDTLESITYDGGALELHQR